MFGQQYYHGAIRKYVIAFGNLFNDIIVQRLDANGDRIQSLAVPIAYGPKEKFLVRLAQDPNLDQPVAIQLPRMGFEIVGMTYSPTRKLSSTLKNISVTTDDERKRTQYVPVPYDLNVALSIFVKNADDGAQILEQILPYFRPEFTTNIILVPDMDIRVDVPVVLNNVSIEDTYEGDFQTRRALIYTLDFNVKAYMYGPVSTQGVIKRAITNVFNNVTTDANQVQRITTTPDPTNAQATDDFGFSVNIEEDATVLND